MFFGGRAEETDFGGRQRTEMDSIFLGWVLSLEWEWICYLGGIGKEGRDGGGWVVVVVKTEKRGWVVALQNHK